MRRGRSKKGGKHSHSMAMNKHSDMMRQIKGGAGVKRRPRGIQ